MDTRCLSVDDKHLNYSKEQSMFTKKLNACLFLFSLLFSITTYASTLDSLFRKPGDPVVGNRNAKVTIVEFFDYQCSHCVNMAPVISSILRSNSNLRVVFKEFPIRGPQSELAASAALAANKQGKYYVFSHALLNTNQSLNEKNILEIAKSVGLNTVQLKKDMNSASVKAQLQANYNLARTLGINGTPAFIIGRTNATSNKDVSFVLGEMSASELQSAINKATA
jgi:protein-disulfide isomerase